MLYHTDVNFESKLDLFDVEDMKLILQNRVNCLKAGFSVNNPILQTLDDIRQSYVLRVGVAVYFQQMLKTMTHIGSQQVEQPGTAIPEEVVIVREEDQEPTFNFEDIEAIQQLLIARAYSLKMGLKLNRAFFTAFEKAHNDYIQTVGVTHYLSQMLGKLDEISASRCTFFLAYRQQHRIDFASYPEQPLFSVLRKYFRRRPLYLKIAIQNESDDRIQILYL